MASVIVAKRKKDGSISPSHAQGEHPPELMAAAEDLIRQIHEKSASGVASALENCYDILSSDYSDEEESED